MCLITHIHTHTDTYWNKLAANVKIIQKKSYDNDATLVLPKHDIDVRK